MERDIERYFVKKAKENNALAFKFSSPSNSGVPDRLVIRSDGSVEFVELKKKGEKPRPLQLQVFRILEVFYGQTVTIIDSKKQVDEYWRQRRGTS